MNNIEEVIKIHQKLLNQSDSFIAIVAEILCIFISLIFLVHIIKDIKSFSLKGFIYRILGLGVLFLIIGALFNSIKEYDFSLDEDKWKENYLKPYIMSLPIHRLEVIDFWQVLDSPKNGVKSIYLTNKEEKPIWCKIAKVDETNSSKETYIQTRIQKESINRPYLTYRLISKNISKDYKKDIYYETILHIPKDYRVLVK
ncbi:MAG: hypothetical protein ACO1OT_06255 [Heyndrickxia sp.]